MTYTSVSASVLLESKPMRDFVASTLRMTGFKWYDHPANNIPPGSDFTGENLSEARFFQRGRKLFLSATRAGGARETFGVIRVRYPDDISDNYIFIDRTPK